MSIRLLLTQAIITAREAILAEGVPDLPSINAGRCTCMADDVHELMGGVQKSYDLGLSSVGIDSFMIWDEDGVESTGFDRNLLAEHWPLVQPPEGMDWDSLDELAVEAGFCPGTHEWIVFEGRHYDAEAPEGVDNPFDLPFFKRVVSGWHEERESAASPTP